MTQREIPDAVTMAACNRARAAGALVMHDPAPAPSGGMSDEALQRIDILTPNESETQALTGLRPDSHDSAMRAAQVLIGRGAAAVVVKMGALGVYAAGPAGTVFVPPFKVAAIDSVGAGDCFNAGLADALARGSGLADSVRFAAACGALATTRYGAAAAAPARAEVEALLAAG
jgi:ribokinase